MKDISHHNDTTKLFAAKLMEIAQKRYTSMNKDYGNIIGDIANACGVDTAKAYGWTIGYSVPEKFHIEHLLAVIFQDNSWNTKPTLTTVADQLRQLHKVAEDSIGDAEITPLTDSDIGRVASTHVARSKQTTRSKRPAPNTHGKLVYHDSTAMPKRIIEEEKFGNSRYEALDKTEWLDIQTRTENFPEFLRVSRLLLQPDAPLNVPAFCDRVKNHTQWVISTTLASHYEIGDTDNKTIFPPTDSVKKLMQTCFPDDEVMQQKGEWMANRNCVKLALHAYKEEKSLKAASRRESRLNSDYFTEKLQRCHESAELPRAAAILDWTEEIELPPIERSYNYLFTARKALNLTEEEVAKATEQPKNNIQAIESYTARIRKNLLDKMFSYYEAVAKERGIDGILNREAYESLGNEPLVTKAERAEARRNTAAQATGASK